MSNNYKSTLQSNNTELSSNNLDIQALIDQANALPDAGGVELPTLTNEGSAADLLSGKQLIDQDGQIVTGTMTNNGSISSTMDGINTKSITVPAGYTDGGTVSLDDTIDNEASEQSDLIDQIIDVINTLPEAGSGGVSDNKDLYQRVEYITSDANSYIITDFVADNESGVEMVASFPSFADHACMGSREDSGNTRFYAPYPLSATSTYFGFNTATKVTTSTLTVGSIYIYQTNFLNSRLANVYDGNGVRKGSTSINATLTAHSYPICLFRYNNAGTPTSISRVLTLYGARCSQKNEVVREYIPCYRKSDGAIGVYEKFTGTFLENAGTGAFTKGADIDW